MWQTVGSTVLAVTCTRHTGRLGNTLQGFHRPGRPDTSDPRWEPRTGLRQIVREKQATSPISAGLTRPRPAAPTGQASYWEKYTEVSNRKSQEASIIKQAAEALDAEVRAAPEVKLCKALQKQIDAMRSISPGHQCTTDVDHDITTHTPRSLEDIYLL